jgi:hypothetical protein
MPLSTKISISPLVIPTAFSDTVGVTDQSGRFGVIGSNIPDKAFGFLAGNDLVFKQPAGVYGQSDQQGVMGLSTSSAGTGVYGGNTSADAANGIGVRGETMRGVGVQGQSFAGGLAGRFIGDVEVTGRLSCSDLIRCNADIEVLGDIRLVNADCAEDFDIFGEEEVEPGTVMVLNEVGALIQSQHAYDKRVAGVIAGAGDFRPGIILDKQQSEGNRMPVALLGKTFCKVDAGYSAIEVGDLLTTSPTRGHAMKVTDPFKALGTVIGKALRSIPAGQGLIPILIALQ